ncbi:unnamed protein product [Pleuronectes platessa]|uniref:Uncharacterized protein n=1 Tax=Pleuronectes platessa TaxID=8262 RepID=A0A9N7W2W8_PLEPL|nr:unnamed protein product [Pleuronectes platessa]
MLHERQLSRIRTTVSPRRRRSCRSPTASEQPQLASGSNTAAQAPPAERSEREHADYIANPRCSSGLSQTQGHDHSGPPDDLGGRASERSFPDPGLHLQVLHRSNLCIFPSYFLVHVTWVSSL